MKNKCSYLFHFQNAFKSFRELKNKFHHFLHKRTCKDFMSQKPDYQKK